MTGQLVSMGRRCGRCARRWLIGLTGVAAFVATARQCYFHLPFGSRHHLPDHTGPRVRSLAGPRINSGRYLWQKWIPTFVGMVPAMVAVFFACIAHAQNTGEMRLPQVTVTAPSFVPLYLRPTPGDVFNTKAYQRNPYFGNNRVEEDKFAPVPCSDSIAHVASVSTGSCLEGYHLIPGHSHRVHYRCNINHDVTIYDVGDLSVEADVLVFDPYLLAGDGGPGVDCFVEGYSGYDQEDFQDMNRITRRGSNWHDLQGITCDWKDRRAECQTKSIEFSYGPHQCIAVRRPGPYWEGGYVWMLTASICHTDMASLQPDDAARALASLQIRTYDPVGNIRPPPQQR
jgi:hypothetical protein